ncbi:MAG: GNAT family N-acetyltransferase [Chloroflexota bacterium]|nr:GNAT family N-acetyltransferase [Chloroflexota bacterium]
MSTTLPLPEHFASRPATMDDVEAIVDLLNVCSIEQIGKPQAETHEIRNDWQSPTFNLETDTLVVLAPDCKIVGHATLWDSEPHVRFYVAGDVHPEHKGQGVGTAICQWAEERAWQAVPQAPEGTRVAMLQEKLSTDTAAQKLLRAQGYQLVRHSLRMLIEMDNQPPEPVVPEGITIHTFTRDRDMRALILADRDAFQDHWGYVEHPFEEEYQEWVHWIDNDPHHDPSLWFLAMDGKEIAGMSLCRPRTAEDPEMGWVGSLGVRRPWRRRGLALALLHHSFGEFYRRGKRKAGLGVDAQSLTGATRLYEKAGMHADRQYADYEKELRPGKDLATQFVDS